MGLMWLAAAAMIAVALIFLLPPLLRRPRSPEVGRDQVNVAIYRDRLEELERSLSSQEINSEQHAQAVQELERAMLADLDATQNDSEQPTQGDSPASTVAAIVIAASLPAAALGLYFTLGTPEALSQRAETTTHPPTAESGQDGQAPSVEDMVARLESRLQTDPQDAAGWYMLARSYTVMNRLPQAREAYRQAYQWEKENPDILVGYAQALAQLNDNRLQGQPAELLEAALRIDPNHRQALWLAGIAAYQGGDNRQALARWRSLRELGELTETEIQLLDQFISSALGDGLSPEVRAEEPAQAASTGQASWAVKVHVSIAPELAREASPTDDVFVFARASDGPAMPLAATRLRVSDLPATIHLDDSMALSSERKLSQYADVTVMARVSKTGAAAPNSGDLQSGHIIANVAENPEVSLTIDRVLP